MAETIPGSLIQLSNPSPLRCAQNVCANGIGTSARRRSTNAGTDMTKFRTSRRRTEKWRRRNGYFHCNKSSSAKSVQKIGLPT